MQASPSETPEASRLSQQGQVADPRHLAPRLKGAACPRFIAAAHRELRPRAYLEIRTQRGRSLALASCRAVAVDPEFLLPNGRPLPSSRPRATASSPRGT